MDKEMINTREKIPTLYDWAGGMPVFERLMDVFYKKVLSDKLLEPIFKHMSSEHQLHVAHFIAEVFGGPKMYSNSEGSHFKMIQKHLGRHLTELHRERWVYLLLKSANELNLPDDPEFRSAFLAYIEWGTRIAVLNSQEIESNEATDTPMPKWGWGETGGPFVSKI